jgi:hypothetical protein
MEEINRIRDEGFIVDEDEARDDWNNPTVKGVSHMLEMTSFC